MEGGSLRPASPLPPHHLSSPLTAVGAAAGAGAAQLSAVLLVHAPALPAARRALRPPVVPILVAAGDEGACGKPGTPPPPRPETRAVRERPRHGASAAKLGVLGVSEVPPRLTRCLLGGFLHLQPLQLPQARRLCGSTAPSGARLPPNPRACTPQNPAARPPHTLSLQKQKHHSAAETRPSREASQELKKARTHASYLSRLMAASSGCSRYRSPLVSSRPNIHPTASLQPAASAGGARTRPRGSPGPAGTWGEPGKGSRSGGTHRCQGGRCRSRCAWRSPAAAGTSRAAARPGRRGPAPCTALRAPNVGGEGILGGCCGVLGGAPPLRTRGRPQNAHPACCQRGPGRGTAPRTALSAACRPGTPAAPACTARRGEGGAHRNNYGGTRGKPPP